MHKSPNLDVALQLDCDQVMPLPKGRPKSVLSSRSLPLEPSPWHIATLFIEWMNKVQGGGCRLSLPSPPHRQTEANRKAQGLY